MAASKSSSKSTARSNRSAAARRVGAKTASRPGDVVEGSPDEVTPGGDAETHRAHPEHPGDSSVAHAPASGTRHAEGGYPSGEYDVTRPESAPAASQQDQKQAALTALADAGTDPEQVAKDAKKNAQLTPKEMELVLAALPVGTVIEHEGPNRWRARVVGQQRFGHGATFSEAVEAFVLGSSGGSAEEAAAQAFLRLSDAQQKEIEERDRKAAERLGQSAPRNFAREEARENAKADRSAARPAPNARTDGPEIASARGEAGARAGAKADRK